MGAFLVHRTPWLLQSTIRTAPLGEGTWELVPGLSQTLFYVPVPFADFSLCPFPVTNQNSGCDGFSELCESF